MNFLIQCAVLVILLLPKALADDFMVYGAFDGYPKYFEQEGQAKGIVVEITQACFKDMQVPFQVKLMPWMRAYALAEKGQGGIIGLSKSKHRQQIFDYSEPIFTEHIVVLVKKGREFYFQEIADLKGKLLGVTRGTSYGTGYDEAVADGTIAIMSFDHLLNGLVMLQLERVDGVLLGASIDIQELAKSDPRLHPESFIALPVPFKSDSKYLGILKQLEMRGVLSQFNDCLKNGQAAGKFNEIIDRYVND